MLVKITQSLLLIIFIKQLCSAVLSVGNYSKRLFITHTKLQKHLNHYRVWRMSKPASHVSSPLWLITVLINGESELAIVLTFTPNHTLTENLCAFSPGPELMNQTTGDPESPHLSLTTLDPSVASNNTFITLMFPVKSDKSLSNTTHNMNLSPVWHAQNQLGLSFIQ